MIIEVDERDLDWLVNYAYKRTSAPEIERIRRALDEARREELRQLGVRR